MTTSYEAPFRVDIEIRFNGGLTHRVVGIKATINSMQIKERSNFVRIKRPLHGARGRRDGTLEEYVTVIQHNQEKSREGHDHAKENYSENTEVLKQVVKRGEEATTSLVRLS
ncbi:hypothetical protein B296_00000427 [Ensete ventricosum]|uniref:Uncharacterized protein n=1 Tax=Ensete ventricosum TaxID=4639 RepID=A0A427BBE9_ENSVE|nr:hypothetical protein B296_00000427 [Ensete ventricosum]